MTLGGSCGSTNQARTMPCETGESIQSPPCIRVWGCAHLQISLGSPPVSVSFPAWQKRWDSAVKNTDCQLLCFEGHCNGGVYLYVSLTPEPFPSSKKHDPEKYLRWKVLKMRWLKTNGRDCFSTVRYLLSARQETLQCFALYFCFCLETSSNGKYSFIRGDKLHFSGKVSIVRFVFYSYYTLQSLCIRGPSGQDSRLEARKLAVHLVLKSMWLWQGTGP